jgi:hypothetical protein
MEEILPGIEHWTAPHPKSGVVGSSYRLRDAGVLIDPLVPSDQDLDRFAEQDLAPTAVVLSNRHHLRESERFASRFGCAIYCNVAGLHEFSDGLEVRGFQVGDHLPGGMVACEVGAICPDETALHLPAHGAIVFADGVVRGGPVGGEGPLGFVPDSLMDDPEETKQGLLAAYARLLAEREFDHLLLAHGGPVIGDGRVLLQDLVDSGGRTAFEM